MVLLETALDGLTLVRRGKVRDLYAVDEDKLLVVNVSGRGDKDIFTVAEALGFDL